LEAHNSALYAKFRLEGGSRKDQPSAAGETESKPAPKPASGKSRAKRRG
jgi:hypothetical protein